MSEGSIEIKQLFSAEEMDRAGFEFTGYKSRERFLARKTERDSKVSFVLELANLTSPYIKKWSRDPAEAERRRAIISQGISYGAFVNDRMVGVLIMERQAWNGTLHIEDLEVMPDWRGRGVGPMLMDKAEQVARELGVRAITLETQSTNVPAIRFYLKSGYQIDCIDLSLYTNSDTEDGEVAIIMKKKFTVGNNK